MSNYMQPVVVLGDWWKFETEREGTEVVPASIFNVHDIMREYPNLAVEDVEFVENKWGARLLAPGTMDMTDWTLHDSEEEGKAYLVDMYGDEEDDDDSSNDD